MQPTVTAKSLLPVAVIVKSYDTKGEVIIKLTSDLLEDYNLNGPVFIIFDELPVPFYIEKFKTKGNSGAQVKFETINDFTHAEELIRKEIYLSPNDVSQESLEESETLADFLIGCTIKDAKNKVVGIISDYLDYPGNPCIEVDRVASASKTNASTEPILIPFNEDLIIKFDHKKRLLQMEIPQGLLEL